MHMNNPVLTNNTLRVKESNTNLILDTLKSLQIATRAEIARITGLSIATCGNILKDLVTSGEILEGDLENCSGGRPARQYIYNKNFSLVIAMTIQSDKTLKTLQYAVTNLYGEIMEERIPRQRPSSRVGYGTGAVVRVGYQTHEIIPFRFLSGYGGREEMV